MQLSMFAKVQKIVVKNAPTILAAMGAVGTVAAVILSSDSAIKAKQMLETEEFKKNNEDICKKYLPIYSHVYIIEKHFVKRMHHLPLAQLARALDF